MKTFLIIKLGISLVEWQRIFVTGLLLEFPLLLWRRGLGRGGRSYRNFSLTILVLGTWCLSGSVLGQETAGEPEDPISYYDAPGGFADPVAMLQQRLADGTARLKFEPGRGYLRSLLEVLRVPVSSQALVFSKTSSQRNQTSPE